MLDSLFLPTFFVATASLFISESVTLLVDNLHAEAIEVVKSRAALSAFTLS
jgi:hypothetical protein